MLYLQALQNPDDCSAARKAYCRMGDKNCGYGCIMHHVVHCMISAYATQRMLVLDSSGWVYTRAGWESFFKPVTDKCANIDVGKLKGDVEYIHIIDNRPVETSYLPPAIPQQYSDRSVHIRSIILY